MTKVDIPYVNRFRDRHRKVRYYFRRKGFPRATLPGLPGSTEFMEAYETALAGKPLVTGAARTTPGSFSDLAVRYYDSAEWQQLAPVTQATYRNVIERFRAQHGDKPIRHLKHNHVRGFVAEKAATPAAANALLKMLRIMLRFALDENMIEQDPTRDVRRIRSKSEGHQTWSEAHIVAFEARWEIGTLPRLAHALLLYTGQRSGDVRQMGWQHVRDGMIEVRQGKTGMHLLIPIHPDLRRVLDVTPKDQLTFLLTGQGKPFTAGGFNNWFRDQRIAAGLPAGLSAHGLRKAAARRLAEAGCTEQQIKAVGGWRTSKEVDRYTRAASQERLARSAIASIGLRKKAET